MALAGHHSIRAAWPGEHGRFSLRLPSRTRSLLAWYHRMDPDIHASSYLRSRSKRRPTATTPQTNPIAISATAITCHLPCTPTALRFEARASSQAYGCRRLFIAFFHVFECKSIQNTDGRRGGREGGLPGAHKMVARVRPCRVRRSLLFNRGRRMAGIAKPPPSGKSAIVL